MTEPWKQNLKTIEDVLSELPMTMLPTPAYTGDGSKRIGWV